MATVFFFLCRYLIVWALIGLILSLTVTSKVNCGALYTFNSWTGNMTILCASTSLMLRTMALWRPKPAVLFILGALCLGHWGLLWRGMFIVKAVWSDVAGACIVDSTNHLLLNINFFYTMGFDFVILVFTAVALGNQYKRSASGLSVLLFQDGLVYFLVSFSCNTVPAVLNILNLNVEMNIIATVPAATVSAIAACRSVIRLGEFSNEVHIHVHSSSVIITSANDPSGNVGSPRLSMPPKSFSMRKHTSSRPEVHVKTESFTMAELTTPSTASARSPYSPYDKYYGHASDRLSFDSNPELDVQKMTPIEEIPSPPAVHFASAV
ncbi:hypothetical protein SERLADRAFT_460679 [Serpula lacrymans var. lacrymans S7.9]|uniref:Uncharacterized protein n=1 Tax=Serpula lacrymans var. lacrymans (strain S7.9) TaxID=578457 RepID=F8NMI1_SERL9|nr:uncharacterized protein SERLADRAFT_460679 [Serpula lacrymans var. lacrymans S7.9]EGO27378.1 hypothetical protein SERLADRAFT_460679 [Serpula lacrymans var. lacrymans S7.9]